MFYNKSVIETSLEGYWYSEPEDNWVAETVTISKGQVKIENNKKVLFIAIDNPTWHEGSKNKGIYSGWQDTHKIVPSIQSEIVGVISQRPIKSLSSEIPQFIVKNTYEVISKLANYAYEQYKGKMIAITGTAGKSTCKNMMNFLLSNDFNVVSTRGNHNTRTGVPLTVSCAITQPEFLVVESAVSGLWMKPNGIMKDFPPDVALITSIDGGQQKTAHETAILKANIAEGMDNQGIVVLNRDMNEFDTVYQAVSKFNKNIITYGQHESADSRFINIEQEKISQKIKANVLGEKIEFRSNLNGQAMASNILGVLTVLKVLKIPISSIVEHMIKYQPAEGVQSFEEYKTKELKSFTILDDSWNATGIAMIEAIKLFKLKSRYYRGKKIAIIGRIENLGEAEAKRQHELLSKPLIDADFDIIFAHGPETKYFLKKLPETKIGGYFENSQQLAHRVASIIGEDDFILLKGSPRSSDFKFVKDDILKIVGGQNKNQTYKYTHPFASGVGAATFDIETKEKIGWYGNQDAIQNEGIGNVLLISHILEQVFAKTLTLTIKYAPGNQALKENKSLNSLKLVKNHPISLHTLLTTAIINRSPNSLLMLANQVVGSNKNALNIIKNIAAFNGIQEEAALNITGRRITNKVQRLDLYDTFLAANTLFNFPPFILDYLSLNSAVYEGQEIKTTSNLYAYGAISHGLFFGYKDSIGIVLSEINGRKCITTVIGAKDAYERDDYILKSLKNAKGFKDIHYSHQINEIYNKDDLTINIIGDTYFGEFYTKIRRKRNRKDALMTKDRAYSFDKIRELLNKGDFNICNFEAALSMEENFLLKKRKPYVLHANPNETIKAIKNEKFNLVSLANNHLLDCGIEGLKQTISGFNDENISTIGAGLSQDDAEKPFVMLNNGKRIVIFNAYWYRRPMYREFDFYAIDNQSGVASLSGGIIRNIQREKEKNPGSKIIVIAHWGVDFKEVHQNQRKYATSLIDAGADVIIGHGAHMIQEIEKIGSGIVAYSIGNGVFNSDGEYNRRHVAPYSLFAQIKICNDSNWELRLYPIYCNNLKTFWQPRFVTKDEFNHCTLMLNSYGSSNLSQHEQDGNHYYSFDL